MFRPFLAIAFLLAAVSLAGCSGSANPQLIASYPKSPPNQESREFDISPQPGQVIYHTYLQLEVSDIQSAEARAADLADRYGGYLINSQTWFQDGRQYANLTLMVPAYNEESLRNKLIGLGEVKSQNVTGEVVPNRQGNFPRYSQIELQLRSYPSPEVTFPVEGWHPLQTSERAFAVFLSIFGFLTDILIWLVVVIGPFILLGWMIWMLIRRIRP